jgi:hypothetical protein
MHQQIGIPRRLVDKFLRKMTPLVAETIELLKENADTDGLTPKLKHWIARFQVVSWAEAYEDFNNFLGAHLAALSALDGPSNLLSAIPKIETLEDLQAWLDSVWKECERVLDDNTDDDLAFIFDEAAEPEPLPDDDGHKPLTRQGVLVAISIIICHNYFACMVHRKSLFQLVEEAKGGNDESFLKAIQIDKRCLADIEYFRYRVQQAVIAGEDNFVRRVMQYRKKPAFKAGATLQALYLVFSLLDAMGFLEAYAAEPERFADLCQELGVYGPEDDAADVESFAKTLRRFKAKYRTLGPPRERWLIVKDTD